MLSSEATKVAACTNTVKVSVIPRFLLSLILLNNVCFERCAERINGVPSIIIAGEEQRRSGLSFLARSFFSADT
jgi:hypothetical protein